MVHLGLLRALHTCVDDQFSSKEEKERKKKERRHLKIELRFLRNILMNCRARSVFINDVINQKRNKRQTKKFAEEFLKNSSNFLKQESFEFIKEKILFEVKICEFFF